MINIKKLLLSFTMIMFASIAFADMTGKTDTRVYISPEQWKTYPYNITLGAIVWSGGYCTAQYINPRLIATAAHCVSGDSMTFVGPYGEFTGHLAKVGNPEWDNRGNLVDPKNDWAIYTIDDPRYYSTWGYFDVMPRSQLYSKNVQMTGFGSLRILSDEEIKSIKQIVLKLLNELPPSDIKFTTAYRTPDGVDLRSSPEFTRALDTELEKNGIAPIFHDNRNLKLSPKCSTLKLNGLDNQLEHDCNSSPGNSGSALVVENGSKYSVVGILSRGPTSIGNEDILSLATQTEYFYPAFTELINKYEDEKYINDQEKKTGRNYSVLVRSTFSKDIAIRIVRDIPRIFGKKPEIRDFSDYGYFDVVFTGLSLDEMSKISDIYDHYNCKLNLSVSVDCKTGDRK
jgi:hypothetical protein